MKGRESRASVGPPHPSEGLPVDIPEITILLIFGVHLRWYHAQDVAKIVSSRPLRAEEPTQSTTQRAARAGHTALALNADRAKMTSSRWALLRRGSASCTTQPHSSTLS